MKANALTVAEKLILAGSLLAGVLVLCAQSGAPPTPFEAASVKPVTDPSGKPMDFRVQPGGRLAISNLTLKTILREAFDVKNYQLVGGPSWLDADHFDIVAKAESEVSREGMMALLQQLLVDRFALKFHWEEREGVVYKLTVGKNGPKLQPGTGERSQIYLMRNRPRNLPGVNYTLDGHKAPMSMLAEHIGVQVGRPVEDLTGLTGEFDFKLNFALDDSGPGMSTAVREQLGLKLDAAKGAVRTLVVDHVEKPTEN